MLTALDAHLGFQYTNTIRPAIARICLDLAVVARHNGSRSETVRHLLSYARNGWRLPGSRRLLAGLTAYVFIGSWYKIFSRAKQANPI